MKNTLTWIFLILLALGGLYGSYALSEAFRTDAREAWHKEAAQAARWLSGTVLGWLEESYAPLSGLGLGMCHIRFLNKSAGKSKASACTSCGMARVTAPVSAGEASTRIASGRAKMACSGRLSRSQ